MLSQSVSMVDQSELLSFGSRSEDRPLIIFLHIPKAGGTTLNGIINQQYPKSSTFRFDGLANQSRLFELSESKRTHLKLIRGHFAFGLHQALACPTAYFTLLRDPIKREISHYYYLQRSSKVASHETVKSMSLEDYILSSKGNLQTRMLCGINHCKAKNDSEVIAIAKQNLDQHFSVIGLVERFDETLTLLQEAFNWNIPLYVKQNVTSHQQTSTQSISPTVLQLIKEHNKLDIEVYQYAKIKFEQQITAMGERFQLKLNLQQRLNFLYQPFGLTYNFARQTFFN